MKSPGYFLVVDFEATCCDDDSISLDEREIIEFGAVLIEAKSLSTVSEFASFVRPIIHAKLSNFCKELTGIRQAEVDKADVFESVLQKFIDWQSEYLGALFSSWGAFDFVQLNLECVRRNIDRPFFEHLNLKQEFASRNHLSKPCGMRAALQLANLPLLGFHHRGIDDARNIARLLPFIVGRETLPLSTS